DRPHPSRPLRRGNDERTHRHALRARPAGLPPRLADLTPRRVPARSDSLPPSVRPLILRRLAFSPTPLPAVHSPKSRTLRPVPLAGRVGGRLPPAGPELIHTPLPKGKWTHDTSADSVSLRRHGLARLRIVLPVPDVRRGHAAPPPRQLLPLP